MTDQPYAPQGFYPDDVAWDSPVRRGTLINLLNRAVHAHGDKTALSHRGYRLSYREMGELVERIALNLAGMIKPGDRVGLFMPNTPYYPIMFFAALKAGGVVVNYSSTYKDHPEKIAAQVKDSGTSVMVTSDLKGFSSAVIDVFDQGNLSDVIVCPMRGVLPFWTSLAFQLFKSRMVNTIPEWDPRICSFEDMTCNNYSVREHATLPPVRADDLALLQYTNGTTGTPKGVMLSHFNVAANVAQLEMLFAARPGRTANPMLMRPGAEKFLTAIPMFHVYGMTVGMLNAINMGAEIITVPDPRDTRGLLKLIDKEKPTVFPAVPQMLGAIARRDDLGDYDLTSLRNVTSGGAALPSAVRLAFEKATGCTVKSGYGLSETSPVLTSQPPSGPNKPDSIGIPYPGTEIRIVNPQTLTDVPPGAQGELWVRGPQVMKGYWNHPAETDKVLDKDGWLRTGDVVVMDQDGFLSITDRVKRMASINGLKVSPSQIEDQIAKHPAVAECVVIRVNKNDVRESLKAIIRLDPAVQPADEAALRNFLREHLTDKEIPRQFEFRSEELPKTGALKPDWNRLEQEEAAKAAAKPGPGTPNPG